MTKFTTGLTVKLRLAYPPISNYDFTQVRDEVEVKQLLDGSMLYIIAQRPVMTFENININEHGDIFFEIHQNGNTEILICSFSVRQFNNFEFDDEAVDIDMELCSHNPDWVTEDFPANEVDAYKFYVNRKFHNWLTPERFIYEYVHDNLDAKVEGNIRAFINYKVLYVGKATDQHIINRLSAHKTLKDILSLERPIAGSLPTHEIALLLFKVSDTWSIKTFEPDEDIDLASAILPSKKQVALDAEKLLIKLLDPNYNDRTKRFANYPKSKDGLYSYNFGRYAYQILDEIVLKYDDGAIFCSIDENKADVLAIRDNKKVCILPIYDLAN